MVQKRQSNMNRNDDSKAMTESPRWPRHRHNPWLLWMTLTAAAILIGASVISVKRDVSSSHQRQAEEHSHSHPHPQHSSALHSNNSSWRQESMPPFVRGRKRQLDEAEPAAAAAEEEPEFCSSCLWHDGRTCEHRKQQVMDRQHKDEEEAIALLNEPTNGKASPCLTIVLTAEDRLAITAKELETVKRLENAKEVEAVANAAVVEKAEVASDPALVAKYRAVFCGSCSWYGGIGCDARVAFLAQKYGTPELEGLQAALEKVDGKCLMEGKELPTATKEATFCESCTWAAGINCRKRVQFMQIKYKLSEREGMDHAMLEGKCTEPDTRSRY